MKRMRKLRKSITPQSSTLSLIESEFHCKPEGNVPNPGYIFTPKHKYFTRSSAKTGNSISSLSLNNASSVNLSEHSDEADSLYLEENLDLVESKGIYSSLQLISTQKMRGRSRMNNDFDCAVTCCPPNYSKYYRAILLLIAIALLGMTVAYINDRYSDSYASFKQVKKELNNIKLQMETVKLDVQAVITNREEMEKKLDTIGSMLIELKESQPPPEAKCPKKSPDALKKAIKEVLDEYDADKTGRTDYALESAGGKIVTTRNTEPYVASTVNLLGVTICSTKKDPKLMITPGNNPGECWAFKGSEGSAVIELISSIYVTGVTLEHIPKSVSPTGDIRSAPREFTILGLKCSGEKDGYMLGRFFYDQNGPPLQYFPIETCQRAYRFIEFKVLSNHGSRDFTCVYRLRVHGDLPSGALKQKVRN